MRSNNARIIELLRGKAESLNEIPEIMKGAEYYLEDGFHVDSDFLLEMLVTLNMIMDAEITAQRAIMEGIGIDLNAMEEPKGKKSKGEGASWTPAQILQHCTLEDNVLKLPAVQFNKKAYLDAKTWIEEAGGRWTGGKVQGFTFDFDATRVFGILHEGKRCNLQQEYQFFATPDSLADWLVGLAGGVKPEETVLEPSAGTGSIVKAIQRSCPGKVVDCYELMPENVQRLERLEGVRLLGPDFMQVGSGSYQKIIANPPFSQNQDIDHVRHMYELLAEGGTVAAIMSAHWLLGSEKKCVEWREWLKEIGAEIHHIEKGEFKESGTVVETTAVVIRKKTNQ